VLFGRGLDGVEQEAPYICEINTRMAINGTILVGLHGNAIGQLGKLGRGRGNLAPFNSLEVLYYPPTRSIFFFTYASISSSNEKSCC
jgi:hypothetical protein